MTLTWATAWARSVLYLGKGGRLDLARIPGWFRDPGVIGVLGFLVPGSGLLLAGHRVRAAAAIWLVGPCLLSLFFLLQAGRIWSLNQAAAARGLHVRALEMILIGTALIAILAGIAWIGQALDGARLRAAQLATLGTPRGDWFVILLIAVIAVSVVTFDGTSLARDIDNLVITMRHQGLRVIPLYSARLASRLDPSEPLYLLRTAQIHDDLGHRLRARLLRAELRTRWREFDHLILQVTEAYGHEPAPLSAGLKRVLIEEPPTL